MTGLALPRTRAKTTPPPAPGRSPSPPRAAPAPEATEAFGAPTSSACARLLWEPAGAAVRTWLQDRGRGDDCLRANRIGADPGPKQLRRATGLPHHGPGAVFPVLDPSGRATYCQVRYITARPGNKYDNPLQATYGDNPRLAQLVGGTTTGPVLICEGMPDALRAVGAGLRAAAVLSAGVPDEAVARALVDAFPTEDLVVAFDGDDAGYKGAERLGELLAKAGAGRRVRALTVAEEVADEAKERDLNTWAQRAGASFADQLREAIAVAIPLGWRPVPSAADLLPHFYAMQEDQAGAIAIPTGIPTLDKFLANGGWRPGLYLLGGLAGAGKSAFMLASSVHAAQLGHPVVYASVEQGSLELLGRLFCKELGMGIADYWNRTPSYASGAREVAGRLPLSRLYFRSDPAIAVDDEGTVGRVRRWAMDVAEQPTGQVPLVIVDYLQRMRPPEADRRQDLHRQISMAGLGLRQLARDLSSPVIAISSIGRASYDKAPSLDAFKGSGDLEYDADCCLLLRLAAANEEEAKALLAKGATRLLVELHVLGKNRYGPLSGPDPIMLDFDRGHGAFREHGQPAHRAPAAATAHNGAAQRPSPPPLFPPK